MEIHNSSCPNWTLPSGGEYPVSCPQVRSHECPNADVTLAAGWIRIDDETFFQLGQNATFIPNCRNNGRIDQPNVLFNHVDPFYSSVLPQMYALGTATIISYLLFIILVITPRTFFIAGRGGGGASFLGRRGMIAGSYGGASVIGVGGRPWLQKVAALTVAVSLSIASAHTFRVAKHQYERHFMDSTSLTQKVLDSLEIRITRVISITFLWLAQVQTLIRLFPRHKEKVAIKWIGFALIVLDTVFTILNNFTRDWRQSINFAGNIADAVPALNYLFELSLSLLYAAWVIFYTISKHRFAFFHPKMKNICLVAILSLTAVLIPVIFFVLDISKPDISPWGEYIRWVGSAAASVVVWEWVERIEALERDERKDGILGREIFDGDDTVDSTQSQEFDLGGRNRRRNRNDGDNRSSDADSDGEEGGNNGKIRNRVHFANRIPMGRRFRRSHRSFANQHKGDNDPDGVDRNNTPSADSTVYRVRCRSLSPGDLQSLREEDEGGIDLERGEGSLHCEEQHISDDQTAQDERTEQTCDISAIHVEEKRTSNVPPKRSTSLLTRGLYLLSAVNIFKRPRVTPPPEIVNAQREAGYDAEEAIAGDDRSIRRVTFDDNINLSTAQHSRPSTRRLRSLRSFNSANGKSLLPVTVIPASRESSSRGNTAVSNSSSDIDFLGQRGVRTEQTPGLPVVVIPARPRRPPQRNTHNTLPENSPTQSGTSLTPEPVSDSDENNSIRARSSTEQPYHEHHHRHSSSSLDHYHRYHQRHDHRHIGADESPPDHQSLASNAHIGDNSDVNSLRFGINSAIDHSHCHEHQDYQQHPGAEREVVDDDNPETDPGESVQIIRLSSSMSSLFSSESDRSQEEPTSDVELHMPVPQPPPLAYQAAATHRQRGDAQEAGPLPASSTTLHEHCSNSMGSGQQSS